jgi:hypothetical protein
MLINKKRGLISIPIIIHNITYEIRHKESNPVTEKIYCSFVFSLNGIGKNEEIVIKIKLQKRISLINISLIKFPPNA